MGAETRAGVVLGVVGVYLLAGCTRRGVLGYVMRHA